MGADPKVIEIKKEIVRSFLAGLLLGFVSTYVVALLTLLVWHRHTPWMTEVSVPSYISIPLLIPIQNWLNRFDNILALALLIVVKGIVYGAVVFSILRLKNSLARTEVP
jgi:hypothetical protein